MKRDSADSHEARRAGSNVQFYRTDTTDRSDTTNLDSRLRGKAKVTALPHDNAHVNRLAALTLAHNHQRVHFHLDDFGEIDRQP